MFVFRKSQIPKNFLKFFVPYTKILFLDVPKASKSERNKGLENFEIPEYRWNKGGICQQIKVTKGNFHPTVKPIQLMSYLITLGCSRKGIVLDPFLGSGTTMIASKILCRSCLGIEINPEYCKIAEQRVNSTKQQKNLLDIWHS